MDNKQVTEKNSTFMQDNGRRVYKKGIYTGKGTITVLALAGIWSVSALTSLPGLAVSPISEKLLTVFPTATDLEIQMLTTLPSLLIIPFILFAGFISEIRFFCAIVLEDREVFKSIA